MTNYIKQRNQLIQDYIIAHGLAPGQPNWADKVCQEFDVTKRVVEGIVSTMRDNKIAHFGIDPSFLTSSEPYEKYPSAFSAMDKKKLTDTELIEKIQADLNKTYGTTHDLAGLASKRLIPDVLKSDRTVIDQVEDFNSRIVKKDVETNNQTGTQNINVVTTEEIKTVEDLIRVCEIDTAKYTITKTKHGTWGTAKDRKYSVSVETALKKGDVSSVAEDIIKSFRDVIGLVSAELSNQTGSSCGKTMIVPLSDIHIGLDIDKNSLHGGEYSASTIANRFISIANKIVSMYADYGRFKKLIIMNLGDDLDGFNGFTTRGGHKLPQNLDSKRQFDTFMDCFKYLFDNIIKYDLADEVEYIVTTNANHSSEFSYVANQGLVIYLNQRYPFIKTTINEKFINHFTVNDKVTYIYCHGKDDKHMKFGLPLILNDKTENYLNDYIHSNHIDTEQIHVLKGDLHQSACSYGKRFRYKNLPAICPPSAWVQVNFGSGSSGVDIDVLDENNNLIEHKLRF